MKSWPNLDVGLKYIYLRRVFIYILSLLRLVGARGDNEQHYFYFKFFSTSISARREPKAWNSIFVVKNYTRKNGWFSKNRAFCPLAALTQPHRPVAYTLACTHTASLSRVLYIISIFMYWIGWVFSSCQACCDPLIFYETQKLSTGYHVRYRRTDGRASLGGTVWDPMAKRNKTGSLALVYSCIYWLMALYALGTPTPTPTSIVVVTHCVAFFFPSPADQRWSLCKRRHRRVEKILRI